MDTANTNSYYSTFNSLIWWKKIAIILFILYIIGIIYQIFFEKKAKYNSRYIKRAMEQETLEHLVKNQPKDIDSDIIKYKVDDTVKEGMANIPETNVFGKVAAIYNGFKVDIINPYSRYLYAYIVG